MKVKVNVSNTGCILVTVAVTVSNRIAIARLVSEIWLATERQTDEQTDRQTDSTDTETPTGCVYMFDTCVSVCMCLSVSV